MSKNILVKMTYEGYLEDVLLRYLKDISTLDDWH